MKRFTAKDTERIFNAHRDAYKDAVAQNRSAVRNHQRAAHAASVAEAHRLADMRKDVPLESFIGKNAEIIFYSDTKENIGSSVKWGEWIPMVKQTHINGTITRLTPSYVTYKTAAGNEYREYIGKAFAFCKI